MKKTDVSISYPPDWEALSAAYKMAKWRLAIDREGRKTALPDATRLQETARHLLADVADCETYLSAGGMTFWRGDQIDLRIDSSIAAHYKPSKEAVPA